jgi:hypothetical protein
MATVEKQWIAPSEAEALTRQHGGFIVRAINEGQLGVTEEQALKVAEEMLAAGYTNVGVFKLHSLVEKGR